MPLPTPILLGTSTLAPICKSWIHHCLGNSPSVKRVHYICDPESGFTGTLNLDSANQISILWCNVCVGQCEMLLVYSLHTAAARMDSCVSTGPCCNSWLGSRDVISHVTIGTADGPFLLVVYWHQVTISHGCQDIEPQTFRGRDLDPFESRDVIDHVTIGTTVGYFLLVIHWHHVRISHHCQDIKRQK